MLIRAADSTIVDAWGSIADATEEPWPMLEWPRLLAVLARARDVHAPPDPRCRVEKDVRAGNGWLVDRYLPRKPAASSLILVHGWTLRGKDDLRLQALAPSLAISGGAWVGPGLPGLTGLGFATEDVVGLRALLADVAAPAGLVGFSFGGGYALLAASDCPRPPRFVVSVSGCGDLRAVYRHGLAWGRQIPERPETAEAWVYQKLAMAWRLREVIALPIEAQQELRGLLEAYCEGKSTEPGWRFCQRVLANIDLAAEDERNQDKAVLSVLSLALHPPRLACPVVVVHDADDQAVLPGEAQVIAEAVRRGSPDARVEVMVTGLLNHVSLGKACRPREIMRLLRLLSPLVQG